MSEPNQASEGPPRAVSTAEAESRHEEAEEMSSHHAFSHDVQPTPGGAIVTFRGEMDLAARIPLDEELAALALGPGQTLSLRLADVTFMDSAGIRSLRDLKGLVEATGATMVLVEPSVPVRRVLELTSLGDFFGLNGDSHREDGPG